MSDVLNVLPEIPVCADKDEDCQALVQLGWVRICYEKEPEKGYCPFLKETVN